MPTGIELKLLWNSTVIPMEDDHPIGTLPNADGLVGFGALARSESLHRHGDRTGRSGTGG